MITKFDKYIKENYKAKTLYVIDVQRTYKDYITFDLKDFYNYLKKYDGNIVFFYNDFEDVGFDSEVTDMFIEEYDYNEADDIYSFFNNIERYQKDFAFLRDMMDQYEDVDDWIEVLRYMIKNDFNDSRDFNLKDIKDLDYNKDVDSLLEDGGINSPYCGYEPFDLYDDILICGGGRYECLAEVEIVLDALGKTYTENNQFIY